ncbi:MAG: hypothetical protein NTY09_09445 [bacterium]|nr:hypothetical protein [bacterium]
MRLINKIFIFAFSPLHLWRGVRGEVIINYQRFTSLVIFSLLLLISFCIPALAEVNPDDIIVTGTVGFDGFYKTQSPTPILITIKNDGEQLDGWLSADLGSWVPPTFYNSPVTIAPGTSRTIEIGCYGAYYEQAGDITISLFLENGEPLLREILHMQMIQLTDSLIVHLSEPSSNLDGLSVGADPGPFVMLSDGTGSAAGFGSFPPKIFTAVLDPSELPKNPILMLGVTLITTNISTWLSLDEQVRNMIFEYVRHGGNILIYYSDGNDPVDGWASDPILNVEPTGETALITYAQFSDAADSVLPGEEYWGKFSSGFFEYERGIRRDLSGQTNESPVSNYSGDEYSISVAGEETDVVKDSGGQSAGINIEINPEWTPPDNYRVLKVNPVNSLYLLNADSIGAPLLTTRLLGAGHAAFASYDPFSNSPTAEDRPIRLLATHKLLNPMIPARDLQNDSIMAFRNQSEQQIQDFFSGGSIYNSNTGVIRWLDALGPALIYLLGLPILVIIAKGRGQLILVLFIIWSVIFTGFTLTRRNIPKSDKVAVNNATLYWCDALARDEEEYNAIGATNVYTCMVYNSRTSVPHTVEFHHNPALLDEIADPTSWPYENITIEEGDTIRLPNLPIEYISYQYPQERLFMLRRTEPELFATGELTVGPDHAHIYLDATVPFPVLSSNLIVNSSLLTIGKAFGQHDGNFIIDEDLTEGEDIARDPGLFGEPATGETEVFDFSRNASITEYDQNVPYPLARLQETVASIPVLQAQYALPGTDSARPLRAYLMLTSNEPTTDVTVDHGDLEQHSIAVTVIAIPIVYEE